MDIKDIEKGYIRNPQTPGFGKSALIGAASSIGSGLVSFGLNTAAGAINNHMQRNNMRLQAELEKGIMDHQLELYRPEAQVQRLRQAGLNPGLMYSGNGMQSGGATGSIGLASPNIQSPDADPLAIASIILSQAQKANQESQAESNRQDAIGKAIENLSSLKDLGVHDEYLDKILRKLESEIVLNEAEAGLASSSEDLNNQLFGFNSIMNNIKIESERDERIMKSIRRAYMQTFGTDMPSAGLQDVIATISKWLVGDKNPGDGLFGRLKSFVKKDFAQAKEIIDSLFPSLTETESEQVYHFVKTSLNSLPPSKRGSRLP